MVESYSPSSDFLCAVINNEVPLSGSAFAEANLARLIELTRDDDLSNRDWATFLVAQLESDRPDVLDALLAAAEDQEDVVRAEAILGLAQLDRALALPLIARELGSDTVWYSALEAAEIVAHPSLLGSLERFAEASDDKLFDEQALRALAACKAAR